MDQNTERTFDGQGKPKKNVFSDLGADPGAVVWGELSHQ